MFLAIDCDAEFNSGIDCAWIGTVLGLNGTLWNKKKEPIHHPLYRFKKS